MQGIKFKTSFFYRSNNRGLPGVDWKQNEKLPIGIRNCHHSILIDKKDLERADRKSHFIAEVIYPSKRFGRDISKGRFTILVDYAREWAEINDYYMTKGGKEVLAIPTILWCTIKRGETEEQILKDNSQLKLC